MSDNKKHRPIGFIRRGEPVALKADEPFEFLVGFADATLTLMSGIARKSWEPEERIKAERQIRSVLLGDDYLRGLRNRLGDDWANGFETAIHRFLTRLRGSD